MNDLHEILARDPRGYSQQDKQAIVQFYREKRNQYNLGNQKAGNTKPPSAAQKEIQTLGKAMEIDL